MNEKQTELIDLLNSKFHLDDDKKLSAKYMEVVEKFSDDAVNFFINLMKQKLPQAKTSKKAKNARENLFERMQLVAMGYYDEKALMEKVEEELNLLGFQARKESLEEAALKYGFKDDAVILEQMKEQEKNYLKMQAHIIEKHRESVYGKVDTAEVSSMAAGLTELEDIYRNTKDNEKWGTAKYGTEESIVAHIEGGKKYRKENGERYTVVSLFINADSKEPVFMPEDGTSFNDTKVNLKDNKGYMVKVAIPQLDKFTSESGFKMDKAAMHEILNNPETAKIMSISEYAPLTMQFREDTGKRYVVKGCTREMVFNTPETAKLLDFATLISTKTEAMDKVKAVFDKAESDENTKGSIKQYNQAARRKIMDKAFEDIMVNNADFKGVTGRALESALKGTCNWETRSNDSISYGRIDAPVAEKSFYVSNNCLLTLKAAAPGDSHINFSITRTDKDGGRKEVTGKWDIGFQPFPQTGSELISSFAKELIDSPERMTLENIALHDKNNQLLEEKAIPDTAAIRADIERDILANTGIGPDGSRTPGKELMSNWGSILEKASGIWDGNSNEVIKEGEKIEISLADGSTAVITIPNKEEDKKDEKLEVSFIRPMTKDEIFGMPIYTTVGKGGKTSVQTVLSGTSELHGELSLPKEMAEGKTMTKKELIDYVIGAGKKKEITPMKVIEEGNTEKGVMEKVAVDYVKEAELQKLKEQLQEKEKKEKKKKLFGNKISRKQKGKNLNE